MCHRLNYFLISLSQFPNCCGDYKEPGRNNSEGPATCFCIGRWHLQEFCKEKKKTTKHLCWNFAQILLWGLNNSVQFQFDCIYLASITTQVVPRRFTDTKSIAPERMENRSRGQGKILSRSLHGGGTHQNKILLQWFRK